jgi:hypothetical protein
MDGHVQSCTLICLETLARRRSNVCVIFVFYVLSGRVENRPVTR